MKDETVLAIVPNTPDKELAKSYRERLEFAFRPILDLINEANTNDIQVQFACGRDQMGRMRVNIVLVKEL